MNIKDMIEKKIKERQKKQKAKIIMKVTTGAIAGIVAGVVSGVIVAPKSGKETRDDITKAAKDLKENAVIKTIEIKEILDDKVIETKINAITAKEKVAKYLSDKKEKRSNSKNEDEVAIEESEDIESTSKTEE
jgi:gas vesicle protein